MTTNEALGLLNEARTAANAALVALTGALHGLAEAAEGEARRVNDLIVHIPIPHALPGGHPLEPAATEALAMTGKALDALEAQKKAYRALAESARADARLVVGFSDTPHAPSSPPETAQEAPEAAGGPDAAPESQDTAEGTPGGEEEVVRTAANPPIAFPCQFCGADTGCDYPSGVCSIECHARIQGFTPKPVAEPLGGQEEEAPTMKPARESLTAPELARICKVTPRTVARWCKAGKIRYGTEMGTGAKVFSRDNLVVFLTCNGYANSRKEAIALIDAE